MAGHAAFPDTFLLGVSVATTVFGALLSFTDFTMGSECVRSSVFNMFVAINTDNVLIDVARGGGEHLAALAALMGLSP